MTGYGEAQRQEEHLAVSVELRTVNSRYLKLSLRASEGYASLESQIEAALRTRIKRGTVQMNLRVERQATADDYQINATVLGSYHRQLEKLHTRLHIAEAVRLESLLALPGVVDETKSHGSNVGDDWPLIEQTLFAAVENLSRMRQGEGQAMAADLTSNCREVAEHLTAVEARAPQVAEAYRGRLVDRLNKLLGEHGVTVTPADVVREVGLFAERVDISEEVVRLRSHLVQFDEYMRQEESPGRKFEFLLQEMNREANTIGSKANDGELARHVVEIKTAIDRMREMVQNVE